MVVFASGARLATKPSVITPQTFICPKSEIHAAGTLVRNVIHAILTAQSTAAVAQTIAIRAVLDALNNATGHGKPVIA